MTSAPPPTTDDPPPPRGLRDRVADLQAAGRRYSARAVELAEQAERTSPTVARGFDVARRDRLRLGGLLAGALAYRFFLWLLPFTLLVIGVLGGLRLLDTGFIDELTEDFGLQRVLADVLRDGTSQRGWWVAFGVGLFGTAYTGIGAVRALRVVHAAAWGVRPTRGDWRPVVASGAFFLVILTIMASSSAVAWIRERTPLGGVVSLLLMTALYYAVWMWVASRLPRPEGVPVRALRPGALLIAVGLQGVHLFTVYVLSARAESATSVYGAIGAALVLLLWLFVVARLLVAGSMLSAELAGARGSVELADQGGGSPPGGRDT